MKVGKPTGKQVSNGLVTAAGVIVGMKASKGVASVSPIASKLGTRVAITLVGATLALGVKGEGTVVSLIKNSGVGMIVQQASEMVNEAVAGKLPDVKPLRAAFDDTTVVVADTKEALAGYRKRRRMGLPTAADGTFRLGNGYAEPMAAGQGSFAAG